MSVTRNLSRIQARPKEGTERFHSDALSLDFTVTDFWRWSASDLVSNATRGVLAEFLVAKALGISTSGVRDEWQAYDLVTPGGTKVEVKSAAYLQSWAQKGPSRITFSVRKTKAWESGTGTFVSGESRRQADVYVFALLAEKDKDKLDPMDLNQWKFFVLPTRYLDQRARSQHSITLHSLEREVKEPYSFTELAEAVEKAAKSAN